MSRILRKIKRVALSPLTIEFSNEWILRPFKNKKQRKALHRNNDPIRYACFLLAIEQLEKENIAGELAECGVYMGRLSKFIHGLLPNRKLYLFDTFSGFDPRDSDTKNDSRFHDTHEEKVIQRIGDSNNIIIKKGYFPETATPDVANEKFAFIVIDFDKYDPTLAALEFFYPLLNPGGFIFIHDYSSPESNWACSRAVNEFLKDKPESPILLPDAFGSAVFRKV
ncbi:MAG: methyltransferase [Bacteroidetes bacterium]|nr:methyltransferase [Bacteroidota bacterium]